MADRALPCVELYVDEDTPPAEVVELSGIGHSAVSVRQLTRLSSFTGLRRLVLHGGPLARLDGLEAVAFTLEELNLSSNSLEHVHGLGSMPKLRVLNLVRARALQRERDAALHARAARDTPAVRDALKLRAR